MSLLAGTRFGTYEILAPIGAGGMGEVYRARDSQLKRDVALKVLPDAVSGDAERLARFQREAEVLAALNHAHIAHIYGLADHDGVRALVMELVEGRTLADAIGPVGSGARSAFALDEALEIARQIAEALEYAHEHGIIHRDLKPANIKITPESVAKVLDFGLAKALSTDHSAPRLSPDNANTPTITTPAMTQAGVILGTASYMSPEQARGKVVDSRADIWAFGVVLFEMLTGRAAFAGDTVADILGAVVHKDPEWSALPASTPSSLHRLLRRCLERDARRRLRDIGEARVVLEDLAAGRDEPRESSPAGAAPTRRPSPWRLVAVTAGAAAIGAVAGALLLAPDRQAGPVVRFEIGMNGISSAAISPDGRRLAVAAQGRLRVRDLALLETREIAGTEGAMRPFWSRDSTTIVYGANGKLWRVAADAGSPVLVCDIPSGLWDDDAGGVWMADDSIVFSNGNAGLWRVAGKGGDPAAVLQPDPQRELHFHGVAGLPDGRSVIYVVHRSGDLGANTLGVWSDGQARVLYEVADQQLEDPVYSPTGHIVLSRSPTNAGVWALPFSASALTVTGEPFLVSAGRRGPSVSTDGTLVLLPPRRRRPMNLVLAGRDGKVLQGIDEPRFRQASGAISPDGNRIAVAESVEGGSDLFLYDLRRGTRTRLTTNDAAGTPAWMPDGRSVLYQGRGVSSGQAFVVKRVAADGSGRAEEIGLGGRPTVSPDGAFVFYVLPEGEGVRLWYRSISDTSAEPRLFVDQAFYFVAGVPSPDGRLVAYEAETTANRSEVYLRRFPPGEGVWQVSSDGGASPRWSRDGRLHFARGADILEVRITTDPDIQFETPQRLFTRTTAGGIVPVPFDVSPDGTRFLFYEPAADTTEDKLLAVQNWFAEFDRR